MSEIDEYEHGRYTVKIKENNFGEVIKHGLDGFVVVFGIPRMGGWKAITDGHLPHQTYRKNITGWVEENKGAQKIVAVDIRSGESQKVWEGGWVGGVKAEWLP